ncbi:phosphoribosyl-AMP cyclohydrolase [Aliamphritea spongicola]|uniref:phosphoribosyl-AMP cyclohydrolase n=1 Tax=Aliamphritea spongicola TaxID=707589 RepID=UPI00196B99B3|nr:phosphoribosyl-AMP cyclohydrolase [Aliamphritea spongicola]MBN3561614.1 phosphoribosyl-AMP cyclohydrolase [Aliamphritea spongicola]
MHNQYFLALEDATAGQSIPLDELLEQLAFNQDGLIPVITQCADTYQVLMQAWMNAESLRITLETGQVTYWSRSRNQLWEKGLTSGHTQELLELRTDCDGDSLLCLVRQNGPACHTGRSGCFYFSMKPQDTQATVLESRPDYRLLFTR